MPPSLPALLVASNTTSPSHAGQSPGTIVQRVCSTKFLPRVVRATRLDAGPKRRTYPVICPQWQNPCRARRQRAISLEAGTDGP